MQVVPATGGLPQAEATNMPATGGSTSAAATGPEVDDWRRMCNNVKHALRQAVVYEGPQSTIIPPNVGGTPEAEATNMPATGGSTSAAATALDAPSTSGSAPVVLRSVLRLGGNLPPKDDNGAPALPPKSEPRKSKRPSHISSPLLPTFCTPPGCETLLPCKDPQGNIVPRGTVLYSITREGKIIYTSPHMELMAAAHAPRRKKNTE